MLDRLGREHEVHACYEASGAGYVLERKIRSWGHACEIVAPSLIPRRPGERRKHDRKDAEELARLYRAGELVAIRVPTEREERVRDLVRCRETFQRQSLQSRHHILKFLARRGLVYREGQNWTVKHFAWLRAIQRDEVLETEDQVVFGEYLAMLEYKLDRRDELDRRIEALALEPSYKEAVGRLCCLKGISTHAAMVLATEIGDFRRFERPGQLMAYVGLVPSRPWIIPASHRGRRGAGLARRDEGRIAELFAQGATQSGASKWHERKENMTLCNVLMTTQSLSAAASPDASPTECSGDLFHGLPGRPMNAGAGRGGATRTRTPGRCRPTPGLSVPTCADLTRQPPPRPAGHVPAPLDDRHSTTPHHPAAGMKTAEQYGHSDPGAAVQLTGERVPRTHRDGADDAGNEGGGRPELDAPDRAGALAVALDGRSGPGVRRRLRRGLGRRARSTEPPTGSRGFVTA